MGERLAQWVSAFDAISLHTAHRAIQAMGPAAARAPAPGRRPVPPTALATDFAQVRDQQAEVRVQFVDVAQRHHARVALGHPSAEQQFADAAVALARVGLLDSLRRFEAGREVLP